MTTTHTPEQEQLLEDIREGYRDSVGHFDVRILPDGTAAVVMDLMTTRAVLLDVTELSWGRRFCFADRALALIEFDLLTSASDVPTGYVARRPTYEDRADPYLNKLHNRPWNKEFER